MLGLIFFILFFHQSLWAKENLAPLSMDPRDLLLSQILNGDIKEFRLEFFSPENLLLIHHAEEALLLKAFPGFPAGEFKGKSFDEILRRMPLPRLVRGIAYLKVFPLLQAKIRSLSKGVLEGFKQRNKKKWMEKLLGVDLPQVEHVLQEVHDKDTLNAMVTAILTFLAVPSEERGRDFNKITETIVSDLLGMELMEIPEIINRGGLNVLRDYKMSRLSFDQTPASLAVHMVEALLVRTLTADLLEPKRKDRELSQFLGVLTACENYESSWTGKFENSGVLMNPPLSKSPFYVDLASGESLTRNLKEIQEAKESLFVAFDLSDFYLSLSYTLAFLTQTPNLLLVRRDILDLPFKTSSVKTIRLKNVPYYVPSIGSRMRDYAEALCPGGRILIQTNKPSQWKDLASYYPLFLHLISEGWTFDSRGFTMDPRVGLHTLILTKALRDWNEAKALELQRLYSFFEEMKAMLGELAGIHDPFFDPLMRGLKQTLADA